VVSRLCTPIAHRLRRRPRNFGGRRGTRGKSQRRGHEARSQKPDRRAATLLANCRELLTGNIGSLRELAATNRAKSASRSLLADLVLIPPI
jgi:hypothetical protein